MSQAETADKLGIGRTTWVGYEKEASKPNFDQLIAIADLFDITLTDLIEKDLATDVQLIKKYRIKKSDGNVQLNVQPSVHLTGKKKEYVHHHHDKFELSDDGPTPPGKAGKHSEPTNAEIAATMAELKSIISQNLGKIKKLEAAIEKLNKKQL